MQHVLEINIFGNLFPDHCQSLNELQSIPSTSDNQALWPQPDFYEYLVLAAKQTFAFLSHLKLELQWVETQYDPLHNFNKGFGRVFTFKNIFIAVKKVGQ